MADPLNNLKLSTAPDGTKYNPYQYVPLNTPATTDDTNAVKKARATKVAKSKLKKKNRKRKKKNLQLPFNPTIESGTVYTISGFSPDFDGNFLVVNVTHEFRGKDGSTTTLQLERCITSY